MDEIASVRRRTLAYWFVDGIAETVAGAMTVLVGSLMLTAIGVGDDRYGTAACFVMLAAPIGGWVVNRFKEKVTYPRTGYVKYREPGSRPLVTTVGVLAAAISATLLTLLGTVRGSRTAAVTAVLLGTVGVLALLAGRTGIRRFWFHAGVAFVAGASALGLGWSWTTTVGLLMTVVGAGVTLVGGWTWYGYLRHTPAVAGVEQ